MRAGTVATHQVVGMGLAFELAQATLAPEAERLAALRERLWRGLAALGGVLRNGDAAHSVPHLLNVSFEGVEGESLLAAVRGRLAVSTGSACTSALREPSYVLRALGRDDVLSEASLRFGLGRHTGEHEIDSAVATVTEAVSRLRKVGRHVNYNAATLRYFETAAAAGALDRPRHLPRQRRAPRAGHLGAI